MIARVDTVSGKESGSSIPDLTAQLRDDFSRAVRPTPGCQGGLVLLDAAAQTIMAVSLWDAAVAVADIPGLPVPVTSTLTPRADASGNFDVPFSSRQLGGVVARVTVVRLTPNLDSIDRGIRLFMNSAMMDATAQGGFRRGLLLLDRAGSRAITIGLWESIAAIEAGEASGYYQSQLALYAEFIAAPPLRLTATVVLED